jgi:hypothetical protein
MPFALSDATLPVTDEIASALRAEWQRLAAPGTWLAGDQRVAVAAEARAARGAAGGQGHTRRQPARAGGDGAELDPVLAEAARRVAATPSALTGEWVADVVARGPGVAPYVETVGVVARLAAVDAYVAGVGAAAEALPEPVAGEPSREPNPRARPRAAFVPTEGGDDPPRMLSAVPAERDAQAQLNDALYLTEAQMDELAAGRELSRPQMELVAARVSYLNGCRF